MAEAIAKGPQMWSELMADVQSAMDAGVPATDAKAQGLARRWYDLVSTFTGGDPGYLQVVQDHVRERGQGRRHGCQGIAADDGLYRAGARRGRDQPPGAVMMRLQLLFRASAGRHGGRPLPIAGRPP